jgi:hypothetical protein
MESEFPNSNKFTAHRCILIIKILEQVLNVSLITYKLKFRTIAMFAVVQILLLTEYVYTSIYIPHLSRSQ